MTLNEAEDVARDCRAEARKDGVRLSATTTLMSAADAIEWLLKELEEAETFGYIGGFDG